MINPRVFMQPIRNAISSSVDYDMDMDVRLYVEVPLNRVSRTLVDRTIRQLLFFEAL